MITKLTKTAIRTLVYLVLLKSKKPISPRRLAKHFNLSSAFLSKVTGLLVKANILRSHRGAQGGVVLSRSPDEITFLSIFEACQGFFLGSYCQEVEDLEKVCAFHQAMAEIHQARVDVLSQVTLADLANKPVVMEGDSSSNCCLRNNDFFSETNLE